MTKKSIACIFTRPPYSSLAVREAIEEALAFATFEQSVSVFYIGQGIHQLIRNQSPPKGTKNINALNAAFPMYDIEEQYWVTKNNQETIEKEDIESNIGEIVRITPEAYSQKLSQYDILLSL
jgi:tRNA 2-thiouridine synthesizing protein C